MFKNLILAAAIVFSFGGVSSAATVMMTNGGTYSPLTASDTYIYEERLTGAGGPGSRTFTFVVDSAAAPLTATGGSANLFIGNSNTFTGAFLSWTSAMGTVFAVPSFYNGSAYFAELATLFTSPNGLVQTLTLAWTGYTGEVQLSIGVAAVPIPAGGLLLLSALCGIAALRRRRNAVKLA